MSIRVKRCALRQGACRAVGRAMALLCKGIPLRHKGNVDAGAAPYPRVRFFDFNSISLHPRCGVL